MTFQDIINKIKDAVGDVTTIDVVTLTGSIGIVSSIDTEGDDKKINLKTLYQEVANRAETDLEVVAFTHLDFDCDSVNFVKTGASEGEAALLNAHNAMVKTAQDARLAVINMIKEVVGV